MKNLEKISNEENEMIVTDGKRKCFDINYLAMAEKIKKAQEMLDAGVESGMIGEEKRKEYQYIINHAEHIKSNPLSGIVDAIKTVDLRGGCIAYCPHCCRELSNDEWGYNDNVEKFCFYCNGLIDIIKKKG